MVKILRLYCVRDPNVISVTALDAVKDCNGIASIFDKNTVSSNYSTSKNSKGALSKEVI